MNKDTAIDLAKEKIKTIRGLKVILDKDLAALYGVDLRVLNQSVKRKIKRFPPDFMFQLTQFEADELSRSQNVILKRGQNIKYLPYVFTEQGVAMTSSVVNSNVAIEVNIRIVRAFVELRRLISMNPNYEQLKDRIQRIESQMDAMNANNKVDSVIIEKKIMSLSTNIRKISETLNQFQDSHIMIKRPDEGIFGE